MTESCILSRNQLKALLIGCGYYGVTGLKLSKNPFADQEYVTALNQLMKKEMINAEKDNFRCCSIIKKIVDCIGKAEKYILIHTKRSDLPDVCCYCVNGDILVCSESILSDDNLSIYFISVDEFLNDLEEDGYFPDIAEDFLMDDKILAKHEEKVLKNYNPNLPIDSDSDIIFSVELLGKNGSSFGFIRLIEYYFYSYILESDIREFNRISYSVSDMKKSLKGLFYHYDHC